MRKQSSKNVLMKDGTARRVPGNEADELVNAGKAKRFISNTVYRALKLGIEVKDPGTMDLKGELRELISAARETEKSKRSKAAAKKKAKRDQEAELEEAAN